VRKSWTYEGADADAGYHRGNRAGAGIACDAATCSEGAENESDVVERRLREVG
jgi:hypothetical protein